MTINSKEEKKIKNITTNGVNSEIKKINLKSIHSERLRILLIGGTTSYLGSYLLYNLIKLFSVENVYCLIENTNTTSEAMEEIKLNLKYYNLYSSILEDNFIKIIPVIGDLNKENFNLSVLQYNHLIYSTNLVLNTTLYENLQLQQPQTPQLQIDSIIESSLQLSSLKEIIKFSNNGNIKRIVYLSNIYNQNENVENQLKLASKNEIPCQIIRITNYLIPVIENNSNNKINSNNKNHNNNNNNNQQQQHQNYQLKKQTLNDFELLIELCKELNYYPSGCKKIKLLQSPINWIVNNITNLIFNDNCWCQTNNLNLNILNLIAEQTVSLKDYFKIMESDFNIKKLNVNEWKLKLNQLQSTNDGLIIDDSIKLKFNNFDSFKNSLSINKSLPNCKNLLISMNSYYGWKINLTLIKLYLNNKFK